MEKENKKVVRRVSLELIDWRNSRKGNVVYSVKWTRGKDLPKPLYVDLVKWLGKREIISDDDYMNMIHGMVCSCRESGSVVRDVKGKYAIVVHRWNYHVKG